MNITRHGWGNIYWIEENAMLCVPHKHDIMHGEPWIGFPEKECHAGTSRRDATRILRRIRIQERREA